ncbi:hypothetical protein, partial [Rugosimonospora acidiphila]|uniref:hypothetical protein n=1 Tax=Rugosimonospora acidiphila TaxID=556531 RepID=UPI0031ECCE44
GPGLPDAGRAGTAADRGSVDGGATASTSGAPAADQPLPDPPTPQWRGAAKPVADDLVGVVPEALIVSGLASLIISAAGLLIVARLRRQW